MDARIHTFLSSLGPSTIISSGGLSYIASWGVFFVLMPMFRWVGIEWKMASALAYGISLATMLIFFALWLKSPSKSNIPTAPQVLDPRT